MEKIFISFTASRPDLGTTQPHIQWIPWVPSLGVKRPKLGAEKSLPSIKNACGSLSSLPYLFTACA
jgi:hypothetical protein